MKRKYEKKSGCAVKDASGSVKCVYGTAVDITEQKQTEAAIVEAARLRALMQTAGAAAHEINQPLSVIVGMSQILLCNLPVDDPDWGYLQDIMKAGIKISEIITRMRNIRQYATRQYIGNTEIVDFDAAAGEDEAAHNE